MLVRCEGGVDPGPGYHRRKSNGKYKLPKTVTVQSNLVLGGSKHDSRSPNVQVIGGRNEEGVQQCPSSNGNMPHISGQAMASIHHAFDKTRRIFGEQVELLCYFMKAQRTLLLLTMDMKKSGPLFKKGGEQCAAIHRPAQSIGLSTATKHRLNNKNSLGSDA